MIGRHVDRLSRVGLEIEEHSRYRQRQVFRRHAISPRSHAGKRPCRMRQEELVSPPTDRLKLVVEIPKAIGALGGDSARRGLAAEEPRDVVAVDPPAVDRAPTIGIDRHRLPGKTEHGGEKIDRHRRRGADAPRGNHPRQPRQARHAHPPLEHRPLPLAEMPGAAGMVAVGKPGAVVAGEQHERVVELSGPLEGRKDAPHRGVDLC